MIHDECGAVPKMNLRQTQIITQFVQKWTCTGYVDRMRRMIGKDKKKIDVCLNSLFGRFDWLESGDLVSAEFRHLSIQVICLCFCFSVMGIHGT